MKEDPGTIAADKLCAITTLTDRRHRQLAEEGHFPPPKRGRYQFLPTIKGLIAYLLGREAERKSVEGLEAEKLAKQIEVLDEDLAQKKRRNRREDRDIVEVAAVNAAQLSTDNIVRQKILELGNRFESRYVPGMPVLQFRKMVDESTDEILTELSKELDLFAKGGEQEEEVEDAD